jgi:acetyltransferase-like isoleucine patch superfamily enzyme
VRHQEDRRLLPVTIGDGCVIGAHAVIYHDVAIGRNSMICDTACVREGVRIGEFCVIAMGVTINYDARIGNRVKVMDNSHVTGNMIVEDDVFIGPLVATANDNTLGRLLRSTAEMTGPIVRRGASVGQGACLNPSVEIGEEAVIGSGAVVTRHVPPRTLVAGVPARVVRTLRDDEGGGQR